MIDALYFATITATTIGYGDEYGTSAGFRTFFIVYALFAVVVVANALGARASLLLAVRRRKQKAAVSTVRHDLDLPSSSTSAGRWAAPTA